MLPCSKAGTLYSIDVDTINGGIPYGDSFCVLAHYCLQKVSETHSMITVFAQIKYKKSVWGLVKGKNIRVTLKATYYSCIHFRHDRKELLGGTGRLFCSFDESFTCRGRREYSRNEEEVEAEKETS